MNDDEYASPTREQEPAVAVITPVNPEGSQQQSASSTPTPIREAIETIGNYTWSPPQPEERTDGEYQALMMFGARTATELPTLHTEAWAYNGQKPNPISINKAKRLLAAAYSAVPCELDGTGIHGYAWMIESDTVWSKRSGVDATITAPTKPKKPKGYIVAEQLKYADQMEAYRIYNHLVHEGRAKTIAWFGKEMFVDLHVDGILPPTITPAELIEHLESTYSQGRDNRRHMETVEAAFNSTYEPKQPVEKYFMRIQEARANAALLGQPYTEQQTMNKALKQFESYLGKDAYKAEKRWNAHTGGNTWAEFKTFWKDEIHQWESVNKSKNQAHQAVTEQVDSLTGIVNNLQIDMTALQAENQSVQSENTALLAQQAHLHHALQVEQRRRNSGDDMSSLTDYRLAGTGYSAGTPERTLTTEQARLQTALQRAPDTYKHLNDGRGLTFTKYCWKCGVNCTHWTRRCYALPTDLKEKYKDATFHNLMGGSTKFLERRDKFQKEFQFDSL